MIYDEYDRFVCIGKKSNSKKMGFVAYSEMRDVMFHFLDVKYGK
jgi:hypothetical protein